MINTDAVVLLAFQSLMIINFMVFFPLSFFHFFYLYKIFMCKIWMIPKRYVWMIWIYFNLKNDFEWIVSASKGCDEQHALIPIAFQCGEEKHIFWSSFPWAFWRTENIFSAK